MNHRPLRAAHASVLETTTVRVAITDLVAHHEVQHVFRNEGDAPIEAVFSFPVPLDAAFMGMEAELDGHRRHATVVPARVAARTYDDAIAEGDGAVLLEQAEPGLLVVSLGNLMPGTSGMVQLTFATELRVADRQARFTLPFAYRPRYGRRTLDALVVPVHHAAAEHPLSLGVTVEGMLEGLPVSCPSHPVRFTPKVEGVGAVQTMNAQLDRDFVLLFDLPGGLAPVAHVFAENGTEGGIGYFAAMLAELEDAGRPLEVCLVLDGSGSMQGDAISQSSEALRQVAGALRDVDRIQVLRFGSTVVPMLRRPLRATPAVRDALQALAPTLDADLGGTEMAEALEAALAAVDPDAAALPVILLVTDGAVTQSALAGVAERAAARGVRIFVVAVGSSAGFDVLEPLALATGGALEYAVPAEPLVDGVMRHLRRARCVAADCLTVTWSPAPLQATPPRPVFPGDVLTHLVRLPGNAASVEVAVPLQHAGAICAERKPANPAVRAILGQRLYAASGDDSRESIALEFGLLTRETSAVLVSEREAIQRADALPMVVPVEHMLPHGMAASAGASFESALGHYSMPRMKLHTAAFSVSDAGDAYLDIPAFLRRQVDDAPKEKKARTKPVAVAVIAPERVDEVLTRLFSILADYILRMGEPISLHDAVEQLPPDDRPDAVAIIAHLRARGAAQDALSGIRLFLALLAARGKLLDDEQEARLALASAGHALREADVRVWTERLIRSTKSGVEMRLDSAAASEIGRPAGSCRSRRCTSPGGALHVRSFRHAAARASRHAR